MANKTGIFNNKKFMFHLVDEADELLNSRFVMGNVTEMYIRFGLSREFLKQICSLLKDQGKDQNIEKEVLQENIMKIAFNIEGRLGMLAETAQYEQMACIYTRLEYDGEMEPAEYVQSWQQTKMDIWSSNKQLRDFFLCMAIKRTHELENMSKNDILAVLKTIEAKVHQLPTLVSSLIDI